MEGLCKDGCLMGHFFKVFCFVGEFGFERAWSWVCDGEDTS